jgi:hypothetical protein
MRSLKPLVVTLVLVFAGCGADAECGALPGDGVAAASARDSAAPGDDGAAVDAGEPASVALLREWITAYDREIAALCPCLVALNAFASLDECMAANGSGPTWLECVSSVVDEADASVALADVRCMVDVKVARASCVEAAGCDDAAREVCYEQSTSSNASCPPVDSALLLLVLQRCPDTALLSR